MSDEVTFGAERSDRVSCSFRKEVLNNVLVLLGLGGETGGCYRQVAATVVSLDRLHCVCVAECPLGHLVSSLSSLLARCECAG